MVSRASTWQPHSIAAVGERAGETTVEKIVQTTKINMEEADRRVARLANMIWTSAKPLESVSAPSSDQRACAAPVVPLYLLDRAVPARGDYPSVGRDGRVAV